MNLPAKIATEADIRTLARWCMENIGLGYHPDTEAGDYEPPLDPETVVALDRLHDQAFGGFGDRVYEIGLEEMEKVAPHLFTPAADDAVASARKRGLIAD